MHARRSMRPVLQALLLADQIIEDKATGKKTIVGVFNSFFITKDGAADPVAQKVDEVKPGMTLQRGTRAGSPSAFVSLTEVRGEIELVIRFVDMHDGNILMNGTIRIAASDPLKTLEVVVPLPMLST